MRDTIRLSEHVAYEIDRLFATHGMLVGDVVQPGTAPHDAVLESFAVHLRNLIEFLYGPRKFENNAIAEDFFADPARWRALSGTKPEDLDRAQKQGHKQIAHISFERVGADKRWYVGALTERLHEVVRAFLDNADEDRIGPELRDLRAKLRP